MPAVYLIDMPAFPHDKLKGKQRQTVFRHVTNQSWNQIVVINYECNINVAKGNTVLMLCQRILHVYGLFLLSQTDDATSM